MAGPKRFGGAREAMKQGSWGQKRVEPNRCCGPGGGCKLEQSPAGVARKRAGHAEKGQNGHSADHGEGDHLLLPVTLGGGASLEPIGALLIPFRIFAVEMASELELWPVADRCSQPTTAAG